MDKRNLGRLGESDVARWADQRNITYNRVQYDSGGWDLLFQFPSKGDKVIAEVYPFDMHPYEFTCMVQVKSTDKSNGRINFVKLINWNRLAFLPIPSFFVVLEYDGKPEVQRAYLVHVDEYWIGKTLKRLRELELKEGDEVKLHKKFMSLTYSSSDKLDNLNGQALETAIRSNIGSDIIAYSKKKAEWIKNVGFEGFRVRGHFSLPKMPYDLAISSLVDFSIGITDNLRLDSFRFEEVRFGISRPLDPSAPPKNIRLSLSKVPPTGQADLVIVRSDNDEVVLKDNFTFYSPTTIFPFIPIEQWKVRFSSELISFVLSFRDKKVDMKANIFEPDRKSSLSNLAKIASFIRHCSSSDNVAYRMKLIRDEQSYEIGSFHSLNFPPMDAALQKALSTIENAWFVVSKFETLSDIRVSFNELISQEGMLFFMKTFLNNEVLVGISSKIEENQKADIDLTSIAFLYCLRVILGDTAIIISGCVEGPAKIIKQNANHLLLIEKSTSRCISKWAIPKASLKKGGFFKKAYDASYKILSDEGVNSVITFEKVTFTI